MGEQQAAWTHTHTHTKEWKKACNWMSLALVWSQLYEIRVLGGTEVHCTKLKLRRGTKKLEARSISAREVCYSAPSHCNMISVKKKKNTKNTKLIKNIYIEKKISSWLTLPMVFVITHTWQSNHHGTVERQNSCTKPPALPPAIFCEAMQLSS